MNSRKMSLAAALLVASFTAGAAELTLYEYPQYGGNQLTLRGYAPSLANLGFNNRAGSIVVNSGRWQLCSEENFQGYCGEVVPGEYRVLDRAFSDRVASAREVGTYPGRTGPYTTQSRGIIKFFAQPTFGGRSLDLQEDTPDFSERGYNDRASSMIISEGVWELCTDAGFAGNCRRYGPGRYPDLGWGMAGQISSARVVRNPNEAAAVMRGGWGRVPPNEQGKSRVILFGGERLSGNSLAVSDTMANLDHARFNDSANSMLVEGGSWLVCSDAYFRGNCRVFGPGRYEELRGSGFAHVISSLRPAEPENLGRRWGGSEGIQLFSERDFGGNSRSFATDIGNLERAGFNDRAASMVVNSGEWELCSDAGFSGRCMVVGPGSYASLGGMTGHLSSMRRVR